MDHRLFRSIAVYVVLSVFISACQTHSVDLSGKDEDSLLIESALEDFRNEKVDKIRIDYIVDCKVRLKTKEESQSGNCQIILTHDLEFLLTVLHPLGGVLLKVYTDNKILQKKAIENIN